MNTYLFITIDTEEDSWSKYSPTHNPVENIEQLLRLQELFDHYGAVPTYLINYPVANADSAVRILGKIREQGRCEIGTHCHPWNTPPFAEEINDHNSMMCNLPESLTMEKLATLHGVIEQRFGWKPVCFRAGRWGFAPHVARCLEKLGYTIDSSVTPFIDWSLYGGPDYREAPTGAYRFVAEDILTRNSSGKLLEVTPSIGFYQKNFKLYQRMRALAAALNTRALSVTGILDRLRLLNFRWLSPELTSGKDMVRFARTCIDLGYPYLNMSFHSTSMLPGVSPFVKDGDDLERFLADIGLFLKFAAEQNLKFAPLSEASTMASTA